MNRPSYREIVHAEIHSLSFQRLKQYLPVNFALTAHKLTRSYLNRMGIIEDTTCTCLREDQAVEHLIYRWDITCNVRLNIAIRLQFQKVIDFQLVQAKISVL